MNIQGTQTFFRVLFFSDEKLSTPKKSSLSPPFPSYSFDVLKSLDIPPIVAQKLYSECMKSMEAFCALNFQYNNTKMNKSGSIQSEKRVFWKKNHHKSQLLFKKPNIKHLV